LLATLITLLLNIFSVQNVLKQLFGSRARVKLLKKFLLHPENEFYVRELVRDLGEQINGIRRELENLKKLSLLRMRSKDRKKYYFANTEHPFFHELRSIFLKALYSKKDLTASIQELGKVDLLLLSGVFTESPRAQVDLLIVGDIDKNTLADFIEHASPSKPIRYSLLSTENFLYRLEYQDTFVHSLMEDPKTQIPVNKLKKVLKNP